MDLRDPYCHTVSTRVKLPAETVLDYMADGVKQGQWTLGSWNRRRLEDNLYVGSSLFSGQELYVRMDVDRERLLVEYWAGPSPEREDMAPLIWARVLPPAYTGLDSETSLLTIAHWRSAADSDDDWLRLCVSFKTEIFLITGLLERGAHMD